MSPIRKLLLVGVGALALHTLLACTSETELNPQPLPPGPPEAVQHEPGGENSDSKTGEPMGTGGGSPTNPPPANASDGGTADGGPG